MDAQPNIPATPPTIPAPATPAMAEGGTAPAALPASTTPSSSSDIKTIVKNLNWIEVGFGILGAAALYYAIYYYRYNVNAQKAFQKEMQAKIDDLNIQIADVNSVIKTPPPTSSPVSFI